MNKSMHVNIDENKISLNLIFNVKGWWGEYFWTTLLRF